MTELAEIFNELGISQYLNEFLEQGFDTWETILDITESDFDALGVKLGHRRKLQRKIANSRGISADRALSSPRNTPSEDRQPEDQQRAGGGGRNDAIEGNNAAHRAKRKYRRHPKPDENAPERPPSAYVIFSNRMREELKGRNLSFTEIAKLVGENWQNLAPAEKETYEQQAASAKERYNHELSEYKKTDRYKEYSSYLAEFKARQQNHQQVLDLEVAKRPKLEAHSSVASSGTASSGVSLHGPDTPQGRPPVESTSSSTSPWISDPPPTTSGLSTLNAPLGPPKASPVTTSPKRLPGYREAMFGTGNFPQQSQPRRESQTEEGTAARQPRLASISDRRPSYPGMPGPETLNLAGAIQNAHRTGQMRNQPPPLLTSESTNRSTASSTSTGSSYFTPLTPMEPQPERGPPMPPLYSAKQTGSYENQLPPLRPPSLSPQSALLAQQSPNAIPTYLEGPPSLVHTRGYSAQAPHNPGSSEPPTSNTREVGYQEPIDDTNLDPVSALLRAGEIVSRNSRNQGT